MITLEKAALWTDGRTFQSAIDDVDCGWTVYRKGTVAKHKEGIAKMVVYYMSAVKYVFYYMYIYISDIFSHCEIHITR